MKNENLIIENYVKENLTFLRENNIDVAGSGQSKGKVQMVPSGGNLFQNA